MPDDVRQLVRSKNSYGYVALTTAEPTVRAGRDFGADLAAAVSPLLMGWLVDRFSYTAAFGLLVATTAAGAVVACRLPQGTAQFGFTATAARRTDDSETGPSRAAGAD
ncbi:hypothetical protein [Amycolatopsis sp. MtRt-6]|uniref:hypothetical protein n=1 Tax=Amycolatopsis sp. MtRt-6 TaxID=2792782 RepID=UPI001A8FC5A8|nr:hypothetical protein [Amycolatopsis sp. MtRt-6]